MGSRQSIWHTGAVAGLKALIVRLPRYDITLGVLTNSTEGWDIAHYVQLWVMEKVAGLKGLSEGLIPR